MNTPFSIKWTTSVDCWSFESQLLRATIRLADGTDTPWSCDVLYRLRPGSWVIGFYRKYASRRSAIRAAERTLRRLNAVQVKNQKPLRRSVLSA